MADPTHSALHLLSCFQVKLHPPFSALSSPLTCDLLGEATTTPTPSYWNPPFSSSVLHLFPLGFKINQLLYYMFGVCILPKKHSALAWNKIWPSSVQSLSRVWHFASQWTIARQASLSITNSWNLPKLMSIESVMPSNHLILCYPLLLLPSIFPSIRVFSNESALHIRWLKYSDRHKTSVETEAGDWRAKWHLWTGRFLLSLSFLRQTPWFKAEPGGPRDVRHSLPGNRTRKKPQKLHMC